MGIFGSKPAEADSSAKRKTVPAISDIDRATLDLKNARDRLQRYRSKLEKDEMKLLEQAGAAKKAGKQERALGLLRLRKFKLHELQSCENQLLNVLQMVETIDSKQNERQLLSALAAGKDTLKKMHEEHSVDDVLQLMDQVAEEVAVEQEINQILQDVPELSPEDELAVQNELEALAAEMEQEKVPDLPTAPKDELPEPLPDLPAAPQRPVAESETESTSERIAVPG